MTNTPQQTAVIDEVRDGTGSLTVKAAAGAGKSTTLCAAITQLPKDFRKPTLVLAFNKDIAESIKTKLPYYVEARTFHSVCLEAIKRKNPQVKTDFKKCQNIFKGLCASTQVRRRIEGAVLSLVSFAKGSEISIYQVADYMGYDDDGIISYASQVLARSDEERNSIDFDDMLRFAMDEDVSFSPYSFIAIDEAQDTNSMQRALLWKMLAEGTNRLCSIGDPNQAIYGFRGADAGALGRITEMVGAKELPLSVSFRCSKSVIRCAQEIVGEAEIQWRDDAPEGIVMYRDYYFDSTFRPSDAILCRLNAPLMHFAFGCIKRGIAVRILGKDLAKQLMDLWDKFGTDLDKLSSYALRQVEKLHSENKSRQAEALADRVDCMKLLVTLEGTNTPSRITQLFSSTSGLTLSTIHKAKGLEWNRVFLLDRDKLMPSKFAKLEWELEQEKNLEYVAITRAKQELYFIESGRWK